MKKILLTILILSIMGNISFAQCTCAAGCSSLTVITMPFSKDGSGEFCYQASCIGTPINSWNLDSLTINGVDFTNKWADASGLPAPASDGTYYIYYKSSVAYGHFEAIGTCSGTVTTAPTTPPADTSVPTAPPTDTLIPTTPPTDTIAPTDVPGVTAVPTATPGPTAVPTATPYGVTAEPTAVSVTIAPTDEVTAAPTDDVTPVPTDAATTDPATATVAPTLDPNRTQEPYPDPLSPDCGSWVLKDNVCCGRYCSDNLLSESCDSCGGNTGALCVVISSKASKSGVWPEVHSVSDTEPWHYSRSTHYGIGKGGACAFGLYQVCASSMVPGDQFYNTECAAFCAAYPDLCADPSGNTFRGNWVAPPGNYYTQFWPTIPGERDNYLSCGECFEIIRTKADGTDYVVGETGYTPPVTALVADSCPCAANTKWCCGSGRDHCYEVSDFKYGCQLPPGLALDPTFERDPLVNESIHIDLCSIAMARLQTGSHNGGIVDGVIPTRYRRVPCPVVGNIHIWLHSGASNYWFALSVVNVKGLGSVTIVEAQDAAGNWIALLRDPNYSTNRPQERYGTWVIPQGAGPFNIPISLRFTSPSGAIVTGNGAINAWASTDPALADNFFIDTGVQFQ